MNPCIVAAFSCWCLACGDKAQPSAAAEKRELHAPAPAAPEPPPVPAPPKLPFSTVASPDPVGDPKEGWSKVAVDDDVPLCLFSDFVTRDAAEFIDEVQPQKIEAGKPAYFGAFASRCVNPECDDLPSLQCWVDAEGDRTLVVHSRFTAYHHEGSECKEGCIKVTAGCPTPDLKAGTYTVRYGKHEYKVRIPASLRKPCSLK
jgi:hypothetical protein